MNVRAQRSDSPGPIADQYDTRGRQPGAMVIDAPYDSAEMALSLREIVAAIRRGRNVLLFTVLFCMGLTFAFLMLITPRYQAEALIMIEPQEPQAVIVEPAVSGLLRDAEAVNSETYVLTSSAMADRVIGELDLISDPEFNPAPGPESPFLRSVCSSALSRAGIRLFGCADRMPDSSAKPQLGNLRYSKLVDRFSKAMQVAAIKGSRVISVRFMSAEPEKAREITNTIARQYLTLREQMKFDSTSRVTSWMGEQLTDLRELVESGEESIESLRQQHGLVEGDRGDLVSQEAGQVSTQLVIARAERAEAEARLGQVEVLLRSPDGATTAREVLDSRLIQTLRAQETELQGQLAELSTELGDQHPRMLQLQAEADGIRSQIDAEINKIVAGLQNQLAVAKARERSFEQALRNIKARAATANENEIEIRAIEREVEANRALLTSLLSRQKETAPQGASGFLQADARIISMAGLPARIAYPNKRFVLGFALIASFLLGCIAILVRELFDNGFRSVEQLDAQTGVAALGFIPQAKLGATEEQRLSYLIQNPASAYVDAIRTLSWSINLTFPDNPPKIVLVTSALSNEGKSTIASSLAVLQAEAGKRTLLIDADIRKPSVHKILDIDRVPGLTEFLAGNAEISDVTKDDCFLKGLNVIPAGSSPTNSPILLGSDRMKSLMHELRREYDLIIIDSSPVLVGADARMLCQMADATVAVVRWGETPRRTVRLAIRNLQSASATLAGTVLSMVNVKKYSRYSYGDSGAYSGDMAKYYSAR